MDKELRHIDQVEVIGAFQIVGKTFGQLALMALRLGLAAEGQSPAAAMPVADVAIFDRMGACKYLCISRTTFDKLRQTEDFGEFEDCGRPKFRKDKLDAYLARKQKRR